MVELDLATWTALGTWALVIGTIVLMYWQTRKTQELNSANAVITLRERFDSSRMRKARKDLATHLLTDSEGDIVSVEVATFLELLGALTHRGVLDDDLVWEAFGTWITAYYWALRHPVDHIGRTREDLRDPLVFHEFEWLYERIATLDRRRLGPGDPSLIPPDAEARKMLRRESTLEVV